MVPFTTEWRRVPPLTLVTTLIIVIIVKKLF